jgi:hypothetical protein
MRSVYDMHSDGVVSDPIAVNDRSLAAADDNFVEKSSEASTTHTKIKESSFYHF